MDIKQLELIEALQLPGAADACMKAGDYPGALDALIRVGHDIPDLLLDWASMELQKEVPAGYSGRYERYQGRIRVVINKVR